MADSQKFGYVNGANFNLFIDKIKAFEEFLKLTVDTLISLEPQRIHISEFCVRHSYQNRQISENWESDGEGGYWESKPRHYWLDLSSSPLQICTIGSDLTLDTNKIRKGRETFANQVSLVARTMEVVRSKDFEKDVLPHIPKGEQRGNDINEHLLDYILSRPPVEFDLSGFGEENRVVTGEDLRGMEGIGYTITQRGTKPILDIGLCKAYYPK